MEVKWVNMVEDKIDAETLDEETRQKLGKLISDEIRYNQERCEMLEKSNKILTATLLLITLFNILMILFRVIHNI